MRLSELIIRFIDWFYHRPVSALLPRQTFRYAVCGGANVVFGWGCYFLLYNFVLDKELLDLGFIAVSPHVAAMLIVFPLTVRRLPRGRSFSATSSPSPARWWSIISS